MKATKNVLVCEDDPVQLKILTTMINQAGYRSLAARTPAEAVVAARRCGVDAVVADVQLQDGNAFERLGDLRRLGFDAPVFMTSAYATDGLRERARAAGARFFFEKPFNFSAIKSRVDGVLKSPRVLGATVLLLESHAQVRADLEKSVVQAGDGIAESQSPIDRALQMAASHHPDGGTRPDATGMSSRVNEQILLMRESNEATRRYQQEHLQEMRRQGRLQAAPSSRSPASTPVNPALSILEVLGRGDSR